MSVPVLHVVARVLARPEKAAEAAILLQGLVAPTRREPGCLRYELLRNAEDPADFTFVEEWRDAAAREAHFATPHMQAALARVPELVAAPPDIRRYGRLA